MTITINPMQNENTFTDESSESESESEDEEGKIIEYFEKLNEQSVIEFFIYLLFVSSNEW